MYYTEQDLVNEMEKEAVKGLIKSVSFLLSADNQANRAMRNNIINPLIDLYANRLNGDGQTSKIEEAIKDMIGILAIALDTDKEDAV